ncbi:hypothetical protein ABZ345_27660 [Lentzea sp. NPDC005914]|uniref:hypothetical protein n=1 Tax=Lentzea sp. NPDC005914 TaxID=3154572 RepID=UPI0033C274B0
MPEQPSPEPGSPAFYGWTQKTRLGLWSALAKPDRLITFGNYVGIHELRKHEEEDLKAEARVLAPLLLDAFEERTGQILNKFVCTHIRGGAALLRLHNKSFELHTVLNTGSAELVALEAQCHRLIGDIRTVFTRPDRDSDSTRVLSEAVYSAASRVLAAADVIAAPNSTADDKLNALQTAKTDVTQATERVSAAVQRQARLTYFFGALAGGAAMIIVCAVIGWLSARFWAARVDPGAVLASTLFGALGAIVSVVQRMAKDNLVLDYNAPKRQLVILGSFRPVVGAIFGAVVQFILTGGLLGGAVNPSFGVFALLGFVSGFSERFATDMIERAGQVLATSDRPDQTVRSGS